MRTSKPKPEIPLRVRALRMLARREYSRKELEHKLATFGDDEQIRAVLDDFKKRGWLSEDRVVEQTLTARRRRFGAQRIVRELREKGISEDLIDVARARLQANEVEAARAIWQKKFGTLPRDNNERARHMRFMQNRGFALETILKIFKRGGSDD